MKWIQIGTSKSGNYWIYNILQKVAERAGLERKSFIRNQPIHAIAKSWKMGFPNQQDIDHISITPRGCIYNIGNIFNMPFNDIDDYVDQTSHVWLHSPYVNSKSHQVLSKFKKLIYIVRDPRDVIVSLSHFAFTPYRLKHYSQSEKNPEALVENSHEMIALSWLNHVCGYLKHKEELNIYFMFYERLLIEFETELKKLLDYLELSLTEQDIQEIKNEVAFETMRKQSGSHLRKGEYGQWVDVLTDSQVTRITHLIGPLLKFFGYALTKKGQLTCLLPQLPKEINARTIDKILTRGNRLGKIFKTRHLISKIRTNLKEWVGG